jgi:hypothetical protein
MSLKNLDSVANYVDRCDGSLWCINGPAKAEFFGVTGKVLEIPPP